MSDSSVSPIECLDCCDCDRRCDSASDSDRRQRKKAATAADSSIRRQIIASAIGSAAATIALSPLSVVKINLQRGSTGSGGGAHNGQLTNLLAGSISSKPSLTISTVAAEVYRRNGIGGFWAGAKLGLLQSLPNTVLYMTVYEYLKKHLGDQYNTHSSSYIAPVIPGIAGGLARMVAVIALAPIELVRTIQQASSPGGIVDISRNIYRNDGVRGFYRGMASTLARDAPFSAIYWCSFELLRNIKVGADYGSNVGSDSPTPTATPPSSNARNFASGASAGVVAALLTHPFDVLKTQRQLQSGNMTATTHHSVLDIVRSGAAFRGLSVRLATIIPASAIMVTIYEFIKKL